MSRGALNARLYPDVVDAGSLPALLRRLLGSSGELEVRDVAVGGPGWATVVGPNGKAQVSCAVGTRCFTFELRQAGVQFGSHSSEATADLIGALSAWLGPFENADRFKRWLPGINVEHAAAYFEGPATYVRLMWRRRLASMEDWWTPALTAAFESRLSRLMPVTSLNCLGFSTTTGYPYEAAPFSLSVPYRPTQALAIVTSGERTPISTHEALSTAVAELEQRLADLPPARHGTADSPLS